MALKICLVLLFLAIIVFFAQEFNNAFKKILAIPGFKFFVPLILATKLWLFAQPLLLNFLIAGNEFFHALSQGMVSFFPLNPVTLIVSQVVTLWLLSVLPVWILDAWSLRRTVLPFPYNGILGAVLWLAWSLLFVLDFIN